MTELRAASASERPASPSLDEVKTTLRRLIQENTGIPAEIIRDESTIDDDLAMDSFSFISLQVAVEDTFDIICDAADIEARRSFAGIAAFVHERALSTRARPAPAPLRRPAAKRTGAKSKGRKARRPAR
jgi:acyl carrier protein